MDIRNEKRLSGGSHNEKCYTEFPSFTFGKNLPRMMNLPAFQQQKVGSSKRAPKGSC